jgi:sugar phosphate isomerase/epimerase
MKMNIGTITCSYYMSIYGYNRPEDFNWGAMCDKYRAEFGIDDFLSMAREIRSVGFTGLEIWEPMFSNKVYDIDTAKRVAAELRGMGYTNVAYCIGGWGVPDIPGIDSAYAFAQALGCEAVTGGVPLAQAEAILPAIESAGEKYGLLFAIENHPAPDIEDPKDMARVCAPYRYVGTNLDTGIYNMMGFDVLAAADLLKDKVYHVHFKDTPRGGNGCVAIGDSDTPVAALLKKFTEWNYPYMVSVEYEFPTDPLPGLYKSLGYINGALKALTL